MTDRAGSLRLDLYDAHGDPLNERVDIFLYHQILSETVAVRNVLANKPILIKKLLQTPAGLYRVFIDPPSYLPVSIFANISAAPKPTERSLPFAIDVNKVVDVDFPKWDEIGFAHPLLEASSQVLGYAHLAGEALYSAIDRIGKAGLLNILAKSRQTPLANGGVVLNYVRELSEVRGDRFFAVVSKELREAVKNSVVAGLFEPASGALHRPPDGYTLAGSFKTLDRYGNLQVTFFASGENWVADIDIDDAAGLEHLFQVVRNNVTGQPTHPYNIHDILLRYQEIDAGYKLILNQPAVKTRTASG